MIRQVGNKNIDLTNNEYEYFQALAAEFSEVEFSELFNVNDDGRVTEVTPPITEPIPMGILFFLMNVMLNQRLRAIDFSTDKIKSYEKRIARLEKGRKR